MHDDGTSGGPMRQVKVDNWGIFFLQRLQQFFNRSDHCDLTLQFAGNVKIKVHRLVLNACTEYFQALEKKVGKTKDNCLTMPADLSPDVVLPIINFMYTGRLEFRDSLTKKLYYTAGRLNMPVLTKLLDAQGASELSSEPSMPTVSLTPKPTQPSIISKSSNSYSSLKKMTSKELPETLPGRKLPIWKKRRTPFLMSSYDDSGPAESAALAPDHSVSVKEEPARPTRFEWPEDEETLKSYVPPFDSITYESAPLQLHSQQPPRPIPVVEKKATFEELQSRYQPIKRHTTAIADDTSKKSKMMDMQSVKEYLQEQEVRKQIVSNEEDGDECTEEGGMALGDVVEDDDEDDDEREAESILPDQEEDSEMQMDEGQDASPSTPHHTKSILKQRFTEEATPASKKVRFALANQEPTYTQMEEYTTELDGGEGSSEMQTSPANHAKIISEVLKKYPHLVRDNKNIRLRIMKQGSCPSSEVESKNKKVSYVVLKAGDTGKNRSPAKVVVKTGGRVEHISSLVSSNQITKPVSGAENTTGPWLCFSCGTNEDPINFETYYQYRRHLQDIHMEKIDARICEHCGHRASKRNLLLYHLYTKHSVLPPRNCQFPKCDQCDYVALSESLLIKHRNNHSNAKDYVCKVCNASFKSNGALQGHMQTNLHSDPDKKKYECPYCRKPFVRNINLKAHVRTAHKDIDRKLDDDEQDMEASAVDEANFDPKRKKRKDVLLLRGKDHTDGEGMLPGESSPHSLEPSSEAEALSNVASGIAASLGLADQLTEVHHDHQTVVQTMPDGTVQTFIISAVQGQEYIVPEMLTNAASGDQYQIATAGTLADLVQYDGTNLGAVVSSLAGASGQQTIVITTAPSGGQEHLKLISADGSTLDQVTLLTGQNLLVTNADGTTSTASATEGYQAILQPNGVLTLQPVGTHVLHGSMHDGDTVTEETLVQQGYHVAQGTYTLATQDEVQREVEQSMSMLTGEDVDTKPYTLMTTSNEQQLEEVMHQSVDHSQEPTDEHNQLEIGLKTKKVHMPVKPRIIGTPIPIQRDDIKSELVSSSGMQSEAAQMQPESTEMQPDMAQIQSELSEMQSEISEMQPEMTEMQPEMTEMQPTMTEMQQRSMEEEENAVLHSENAVDDLGALHESVSTLEQENAIADPSEDQGQVLETEELQEEEAEMQQEEVSEEQDMEPQQVQHQEDSSQDVHGQLSIEEEHQGQEGEKVCSDEVQEEQVTQEMVQEEGSSDMIDAGGHELVAQYHSNRVEEGEEDSMMHGVEGEGELETIQGVEEGDQAMEEEEGTLLIEGDDEQGPLMIEAEEATIATEEEQGELLMGEDEVLSQEQSQHSEEQGVLTIEADQQESVSQDNSGSGIPQDQPPSDSV